MLMLLIGCCQLFIKYLPRAPKPCTIVGLWTHCSQRNQSHVCSVFFQSYPCRTWHWCFFM